MLRLRSWGRSASWMANEGLPREDAKDGQSANVAEWVGGMAEGRATKQWQRVSSQEITKQCCHSLWWDIILQNNRCFIPTSLLSCFCNSMFCLSHGFVLWNLLLFPVFFAINDIHSRFCDHALWMHVSGCCYHMVHDITLGFCNSCLLWCLCDCIINDVCNVPSDSSHTTPLFVAHLTSDS